MASTCGHSQEMGTIIFTSKKQHQGGLLSKKDTSLGLFPYFLILLSTVFALAVMEYAVGVSKFGKNPMTL